MTLWCVLFVQNRNWGLICSMDAARPDSTGEMPSSGTISSSTIRPPRLPTRMNVNDRGEDGKKLCSVPHGKAKRVVPTAPVLRRSREGKRRREPGVLRQAKTSRTSITAINSIPCECGEHCEEKFSLETLAEYR